MPGSGLLSNTDSKAGRVLQRYGGLPNEIAGGDGQMEGATEVANDDSQPRIRDTLKSHLPV